MKTSPVIKEVERGVEQLQKKLLSAVREGVNEILLRYPFVDDYDQGMGSATFNITVDNQSFMIQIDQDDPLHDVENYLAINEVVLDRQTARKLAQFGDDCRTLQKYHDTWSDYFTGALAGEPMSFRRHDIVKPSCP